jgi:hypothetical protein
LRRSLLGGRFRETAPPPVAAFARQPPRKVVADRLADGSFVWRRFPWPFALGRAPRWRRQGLGRCPVTGRRRKVEGLVSRYGSWRFDSSQAHLGTSCGTHFRRQLTPSPRLASRSLRASCGPRHACSQTRGRRTNDRTTRSRIRSVSAIGVRHRTRFGAPRSAIDPRKSSSRRCLRKSAMWAPPEY